MSNDDPHVSGPARLAYLAVGWACVGLGMLGAVLPVMPTTPFLLVAVWAFARSSRRFHDWVLEHRTFGAPVRAWRHHGVISVRTKVVSLSAMTASFGYILLFVAEGWLLPAVAGSVMAATAVFILSRPSTAAV